MFDAVFTRARELIAGPDESGDEVVEQAEEPDAPAVRGSRRSSRRRGARAPPRNSSRHSTHRPPRPTSDRRRPARRGPRSRWPGPPGAARWAGRSPRDRRPGPRRRGRCPPVPPAPPPGSGGRAPGGSRWPLMSPERTRSSTWAKARARSKRKGHHSSPTASWNERSPRPSARTRAGRSARHAAMGGVAPGQRLGQQDGAVSQLLAASPPRGRADRGRPRPCARLPRAAWGSGHRRWPPWRSAPFRRGPSGARW